MKRKFLKLITKLKQIKRLVLREWYKMYRHNTFTESALGKFRVRYKDGKITQPMDWDTAKNYSEIFGGTIIDNF